jgi:lambda repressor-like predicted transcriptional regulator
MTFSSTEQPGDYVPAATIRADIQRHLKDTGMSHNHFAKEAKLDTTVIRKIITGQSRKVAVTTAEAVKVALRETVGITQLPDTLPVGPIADALHLYALASHIGLSTLLGHTEIRTLNRSLKAGVCSTLWADRMSCHVLGRPLELIYGPTWDTDHLKEAS